LQKKSHSTIRYSCLNAIVGAMRNARRMGAHEEISACAPSQAVAGADKTFR